MYSARRFVSSVGSFRHDRLRRYFDRNPGRLLHKWLHYFAVYERHFHRFRRRGPVILEIGVSHGGSLDMWRDYFGRTTRVVGIDIDPRVASLADTGVSVEIGDQADATFLGAVADKHGPFDIIVDDGSHQFGDQIASLEFLWPHLKVGGVYLIEDLHTSYWAEYGGGLGVDTTFVEWLKHRYDDMNAFHSREPGFAPNMWTSSIASLHLYDSIAVLEKGSVHPPEARMTGRPAFATTYGRPTEEFIDPAHRRQLAAVGTSRARVGRLIRHPLSTTRRVARRVVAGRR